MPDWLREPVITRLLSIPVSAAGNPSSNLFSESPHGQPNHVLINEYPPGVGIMPHARVQYNGLGFRLRLSTSAGSLGTISGSARSDGFGWSCVTIPDAPKDSLANKSVGVALDSPGEDIQRNVPRMLV